MRAITKRLKKLHKYLTRENNENSNFAEKRLKQAYGLTLKLIGLIEKAAKRSKRKVGDCFSAIAQNLWLMKMQVKGMYQESMWILHQSYINIMKLMNNYVIYSKAFYDTYASLREEFEEKFLTRAQTLCDTAGLKMNLQEAKEFFNEANTLWEAQENDQKDILTTLDKAAGLQIGKPYGVHGLNFYSAYVQAIKENPKATLNNYLESCKEVFGKEWKDDYAKASEYYIYTRWNITRLNIDYLKKYAAEHSWTGKVKALMGHMLNMVVESYLNLYGSLLETYYDEEVMKYSELQVKDTVQINDKMERLLLYNTKAKEVFRYYGSEIKKYIKESRLYAWTGASLEFTKSNGLKLKQLCHMMVKKFKEGVVIIYDKGSHTVTVVIETLKNPGKIAEYLKTKFKNLKAKIAGCVLVLNFDIDGWVLMANWLNIMKHLYKTLQDANYLGNAKGLYLKAIGSMRKKEEIEAEKVS